MTVIDSVMIEREEFRGRLSPLEHRVARWIGRTVDRSKFVTRAVNDGLCLATAMGPRTENQDRVACISGKTTRGRGFTALVLCDGIGGLIDGGKCADIAIASIAGALFTSDGDDGRLMLEAAVRHANGIISRLYSGRGGATLSLVLLDASRRMHAINVGDSRIFTRKRHGPLQQRSIDDTLQGQLSQLGAANEADAIPEFNHLLQYLGMGKGLRAEPFEIDEERDVRLVVMTSDGAHGIGEGLIERVIRNSPSLLNVTRRLITMSEWLGGADNATIGIWDLGLLHKFTRLDDDTARTLQIADPWDTIEFVFNVIPPTQQSDHRPQVDSRPSAASIRREKKTKKGAKSRSNMDVRDRRNDQDSEPLSERNEERPSAKLSFPSEIVDRPENQDEKGVHSSRSDAGEPGSTISTSILTEQNKPEQDRVRPTSDPGNNGANSRQDNPNLGLC